MRPPDQPSGGDTARPPRHPAGRSVRARRVAARVAPRPSARLLDPDREGFRTRRVQHGLAASGLIAALASVSMLWVGDAAAAPRPEGTTTTSTTPTVTTTPLVEQAPLPEDTVTSTTELPVDESLGRIVPRPNSGHDPIYQGDRGTGSQYAVFLGMIVAIAGIALFVVRQTRRSSARWTADAPMAGPEPRSDRPGQHPE